MKKIILSLFLICLSITSFAQWQLTSFSQNGGVNCITTSSTIVYAGSPYGVFSSSNDGSSWNNITYLSPPYTSAPNNTQSLAFSGTNIFAGTNAGVFIMNWNTWTAINNGLTSNNIQALAISSGTNIFAGTNYGGIFLSTDYGNSWTAVNTGLTSHFIMSLAISGTNIFAGTNGGVFLSTNNGASWTAINNGLTSNYILSLAISGTNIFAGTNGGVFVSANNGASWTAVNNGLVPSNIRSLAISGYNIFASTDGLGVFYSNNSGASWNPVNNGLTFSLNTRIILAISGTSVFAGTSVGEIWRRPLSEMVVGMEESAKNTNVEFYPNPNNGNFYVDFKESIKDCNIKIIDMVGKIISEQEIKSKIDKIEFNLEIDKGIYFLNIYDNDNKLIIYKKIVID